MKFFIDTANLDQIKEAQALGILDGVTTNPSLMAKEGIKGQKAVNQHYIDICEIVDGDVSAEVIATDFDNIVKEGKALAALHDQIVVKVPMIKDGIKAISISPLWVFAPTVHLFLVQDKPYWQLKQEQLIFLLS